jgi:hypothetical protein
MGSNAVAPLPLHDGYGRLVSFLHLDSLGPVALTACPPKHFVVFVAADATSAQAPILMAFAASLVRAGCVYAVCWGPDSSSMEEAFDYADIEVHGDAEPSHVVMTTSHNDEPLEEALTFLTESARPTDRYVSTCKHVLVVVVGGAASEPAIRAFLQRR